MRILLDARKLGDGGIGRYVENLVDGLLELRQSGEISFSLTMFVSPAALCGDRVLDERLRRWQGKVRFIPESARKYSLDEYLGLSLRQRHELRNHDLFHSPHYTLPFFVGAPSVVTIHDLIHITAPETIYHRPLGKRLIGSALARAEHVITVSEDSKLTLQRFFPDTTTPVTVIPNALSSVFVRQSEYDVNQFCVARALPRRFILFVGSDRPHKGFREMIGAMSILAEEGGDCPELLVVGERFSPSSKLLCDQPGLSSRVHFLGSVTDDNLTLLYSGAQAVVIPSRLEGFGLVALEAMACGAPLVCTPVPSLTEICGEYAVWTIGFSSESLAQALGYLLHNGRESAARAAQGMERASMFSRQAAARSTWGIYDSLARCAGREVSGRVWSFGELDTSASKGSAGAGPSLQ